MVCRSVWVGATILAEEEAEEEAEAAEEAWVAVEEAAAEEAWVAVEEAAAAPVRICRLATWLDWRARRRARGQPRRRRRVNVQGR